jgi:hypothetical protein
MRVSLIYVLNNGVVDISAKDFLPDSVTYLGFVVNFIRPSLQPDIGLQCLMTPGNEDDQKLRI